MPRTAPPDVDRFMSNKSRITDYYEHNADTIREKKTVVAMAKMFEEMAWLCKEIRRLAHNAGGLRAVPEINKFLRIERAVARVLSDQPKAVATNQFIKVRSDIFSAWRLLIRILEPIMHAAAGDELNLDLGVSLGEDESGRVVIDLEDGLGEEEDDEPRKAKPKPIDRRPPDRRPVPPPPVVESGSATVAHDPGQDDDGVELPVGGE